MPPFLERSCRSNLFAMERVVSICSFVKTTKEFFFPQEGGAAKGGRSRHEDDYWRRESGFS